MKSWCVYAALVFSFWTSGALAEGRRSATEPAEYRQLVSDAVAEFDAKNFAESRALFARADALASNARTLRGIGLAEFELRAYRDCIAHLEQALASQAKPLTGAMRAETERVLERARGFVGKVQLLVEPANATVSINGVAAAEGEQRELLLEMGEYVLEITAPARLSTRRVVRISGGENETLQITLSAPPVEPEPVRAVPLVAPITTPERSERRVYKSPWLWTAVGVVLVGAGVGLGLALSKDSKTTTEPAYGGDTGAIFRGP